MNEVASSLSESRSSAESEEASKAAQRQWATAEPEISSHLYFGGDDFDMSIWTDRFLPPPPRPDFLESSVGPDGVTTCDLCSWARSPDRNDPAAGELGWVLTLVIVSIISAAVGAVIMVTLLHCRRRNNSGKTDLRWWPCTDDSVHNQCSRNGSRESCATKSPLPRPRPRPRPPSPPIWARLARARRAPPSPVLRDGASNRAQNHYTHVLDPGPIQDDTLYAELDRTSVDSSVPAYQNSAYADVGEPIAWSTPSSAYYSDLSTGGIERPYEMVGINPPTTAPPSPGWLECVALERRPSARLAAISEVAAVASSEYV